MPQPFRRLSHSICKCKNHIIFCAKHRYRILKDGLREYAEQQVHLLYGQEDQVTKQITYLIYHNENRE
jgi:REP element-mobilizing transposase RayT